MGPFHDQVKQHITHLVLDPNLLLDTEKHGSLGHLTGGIWHEPKVFEALRREQARGALPFLHEMLAEFC